MKTSHRIALCSVFALVLATSTGLAQSTSEPCGQVTRAAGQTETSIQACTGELLDEQLLMINAVERMGAQLRAINLSMLAAQGTTAGQRAWLLGYMSANDDDIQLMRDQLARARQENLAVEDSDYDVAFEKGDQQKGENCKFSDMPFFEALAGEFPPGLKPYSGAAFDPKFGDGRCNVFKARIDDPGEPDDNEVVRVNERSENMCEWVCEDRPGEGAVSGVGSPPRPRKEERKERTVFAMTENIAAARRANAELEAGLASMAALRLPVAVSASRVAGDDPDNCEPFDVARILEEAAEVVSLAKNAVGIVTASLELAKETVRPPSKQTVAGFNASTAETPFSVAAGISKIVEQVVGTIEQGLKVGAAIAGRVQDFAQAQCLQRVQTQVSVLQQSADDTGTQLDVTNAKLDEAQAELVALEAKVDALDALLDQVLELLRTPPGRRDGFPQKP